MNDTSISMRSEDTISFFSSVYICGSCTAPVNSSQITQHHLPFDFVPRITAEVTRHRSSFAEVSSEALFNLL